MPASSQTAFAAAGEERPMRRMNTRKRPTDLTARLATLAVVLMLAISADAPVIANPGQTGTPAVDRVGFPRDYRASLKLLSVSVKDDEPSVMTAYGNEQATAITASSQLPYPYGTVIAMEFAHGVRDGEKQIMHDASGTALKGDVARIDVMRRERGYGEIYGDNRAGEWEFASYRPDGTTLVSPEKGGTCAACHRKAGPERDFVYRLRVPAK
jgi:hypothetical protein